MTARHCRAEPDKPPSLVLQALHRHIDAYLAQYGFDPILMSVLLTLISCRTVEMGTHECVCDACGWKGHSFNSCSDRHCPQCQGRATAKWLETRNAQMLPVPHFQVVFTLPAELRAIAYDNQELIYALLIRTSASILQDLAAQRLDARLGITAVLHTWSSEMSYHPHAHLLVTAGGLSLDDQHWVEISNNGSVLLYLPGSPAGRGPLHDCLRDRPRSVEVIVIGNYLQVLIAFNADQSPRRDRDRTAVHC